MIFPEKEKQGSFMTQPVKMQPQQMIEVQQMKQVQPMNEILAQQQYKQQQLIYFQQQAGKQQLLPNNQDVNMRFHCTQNFENQGLLNITYSEEQVVIDVPKNWDHEEARLMYQKEVLFCGRNRKYCQTQTLGKIIFVQGEEIECICCPKGQICGCCCVPKYRTCLCCYCGKCELCKCDKCGGGHVHEQKKCCPCCEICLKCPCVKILCPCVKILCPCCDPVKKQTDNNHNELNYRFINIPDESCPIRIEMCCRKTSLIRYKGKAIGIVEYLKTQQGFTGNRVLIYKLNSKQTAMTIVPYSTFLHPIDRSPFCVPCRYPKEFDVKKYGSPICLIKNKDLPNPCCFYPWVPYFAPYSQGDIYFDSNLDPIEKILLVVGWAIEQAFDASIL